MSHRPTQRKKIAGLRRALQGNSSTAVPHIDLVQWLKDRRYARTSGEAERILLAGRVKSESHTLGTIELFDPLKNTNRKAVQRYVPASLRSTLRVDAETEE